MVVKNRETGIRVIGSVPWGLHICVFYDNSHGLVDVLVPYFKAGLQNNESCIWITSETISKKEAEEAMGKAMTDFSQHLASGQMEIIPYIDWYLKGGVFNGKMVFNAWIDKLKRALASGYDGLRVSGDTAWVDRRYWTKFMAYEGEINQTIGKCHMLALCTYPLHKHGTSQVTNVMSHHQYSLIQHKDKLVLIGGSARERVAESLTVLSRVKSGKHLTALQERFVRKGFEGLEDQEIIELLLSLVLPVQKAKQLARACIERFQNLSDFLAAPPKEQQEVGITPASMLCIKLLHELPAKVLKQRIVARSIYKSSKEVFDYLYYSMRDLKKEVFKVIYLNNRSQIIDTADLFAGTSDNIFIRPREIIESTLTQGATALIFVHNHPTGDPTPSRSDKQLTKDLVFVGNILQIKVLDHIIIGADSYFSFTDDGLTQKYQDSFLNLKIRGVLTSRQLYHIYRHLPKGLHHQHLTKLFNECQLIFPD
ncbi:MAG: DNA repair protein RadC [Dehalococcoidales bacterium]